MQEMRQTTKRCLVTGGAGFIGSHVVEALVQEGYEVRVFDLPNVSLANLGGVAEQIEIIVGDLINEEDTARAVENIDIVVHLAGTTVPASSNQNPHYDLETNVGGTLILLDKAIEKGVKKVVFASSGGTVYGIPKHLPISETHPTFPCCSYGISKLTVEKYLYLYHYLYGLDYNVLRVGNAFGERQKTDRTQGAIAVFFGKVLKGKPIIIWGDGSVSRDYVYVKDVARAFVAAVQKSTRSKIFNIGTGTSCSLNELLRLIQQVTGRSPQVVYQPGRKFDVPQVRLDIRLAKRELGWLPQVDLSDGIHRTWTWLIRSVARHRNDKNP